MMRENLSTLKARLMTYEDVNATLRARVEELEAGAVRERLDSEPASRTADGSRLTTAEREVINAAVTASERLSDAVSALLKERGR